LSRGPKESTHRGRRAGGRELRAWVSAAEFAEVAAAAAVAGQTRDAFVRDAALERARREALAE
jgi:uncharacterized protein (DUF1778 family)